LFPICITCLTSYLVAEALRGPAIYDALLEADLERSGHAPARPEPRRIYIGIQSGSPVAGKVIARADLPKGCLVIAVERGGLHLLPAADMQLLPGDHVTILAPGDLPEAPMDIVRLCTGL